MPTKAVVVFSGGQDSTTCLVWAQRRYDEVHTVTFDYGQRHHAEIAYASRLAEHLQVAHHVLPLPLLNDLAPNALTRMEVPVTPGAADGLPSTFVDGRNLLFLSYAAIFAKQLGASKLIAGVCQTDFSGYPDCRDVFIKSLNVTLNLAMDFEFVIETPLMWLTKAETWALADTLGCLQLVREHTVTCYHGIPGDGCGECPACVLRKRGLETYLQSRTGT